MSGGSRPPSGFRGASADGMRATLTSAGSNRSGGGFRGVSAGSSHGLPPRTASPAGGSARGWSAGSRGWGSGGDGGGVRGMSAGSFRGGDGAADEESGGWKKREVKRDPALGVRILVRMFVVLLLLSRGRETETLCLLQRKQGPHPSMNYAHKHQLASKSPLCVSYLLDVHHL